ncbi:MAG TPA: DegV family protein [Dehalococcoidia bacterium]|nr:DegV family protein [Dehalococcoidia bacterium]
MTVKVVTDSGCDIPPEIVRELDITVIPLYVRFGDRVYRDWVDIDADTLYERLVSDPVHPSTSQPPVGDFIETYKKVAQETNEIVSVHITSKLSGTYSSALAGAQQAMQALGKQLHIEVVDSLSASMGMGLLAILAARLARAGESLERIAAKVRQAVPNTKLFAFLDTMKYVERGGRLGKAAALLGTMLNVKPLLALKDGEAVPVGLARTRAKALERLREIAERVSHIRELAIVHSGSLTEAQSLLERLSSVVAKGQTYLSKIGPALGCHAGPGAVAVIFREGGEEE